METYEVVLLAIGVAIVLVVVVGAVRSQRAAQVQVTREPQAGAPIASVVDGGAIIVLDVERADPASPAVERMVREAAARVYRMMPSAERVEVRSSSGSTLGVVRRTPPPEHRVLLPTTLAEPHVARSLGPDLTRHLAEPEEAEPPPSPPPAPPTFPRAEPPHFRYPLTEQFDLPEAVRGRLGDADDPVELVRAILEGSGATVQVEGDALRVGQYAVMVLIPPGHVVEPRSLDHAFFCIERTGAARGLVIGMGILDVADVRRREAFAPHVLHTGPDGIQRMADAVAIGEDPLRFAAGPALAGIPQFEEPAEP